MQFHACIFFAFPRNEAQIHIQELSRIKAHAVATLGALWGFKNKGRIMSEKLTHIQKHTQLQFQVDTSVPSQPFQDNNSAMKCHCTISFGLGWVLCLHLTNFLATGKEEGQAIVTAVSLM